MLRPLVCFVILATCLIGLAQAQYQWRDGNGRMVYSDMPPPTGTPASRILRAPARPGTRNPASEPGLDTEDATDTQAAADGGATTIAAPVSAPAPGHQDKLKAFEKRREERLQQENQATLLARESADHAQACAALAAEQKTLAAGGRVVSVGADGTRQAMDDSMRKARLEQNAEALAEHCKP